MGQLGFKRYKKTYIPNLEIPMTEQQLRNWRKRKPCCFRVGRDSGMICAGMIETMAVLMYIEKKHAPTYFCRLGGFAITHKRDKLPRDCRLRRLAYRIHNKHKEK